MFNTNVFVNGSLTATKMIFDKGNIRTYIYIFWIVRSFMIEFLKGQIVYSFVLLFHSIVLYSTKIFNNQFHLIFINYCI